SATGVVPPFDPKQGYAIFDPVEPFVYTLQSSQIHVFEIVDFSNGTVVESNGSPYPIPIGSGGLVLTHNSSTQPPAQHVAELVPPAMNFQTTNLGQSTSNPPLLLTNIGTEPLNIADIATSDASNFAFTTTCPLQLASRTSCSITVTFSPTVAAPLGATL